MSNNHNNENNSMSGMIWMMAICCLMPILFLLFAGSTAITSGSLLSRWPILLIVAFIVGAHIFMMRRNKGCHGGQSDTKDGAKDDEGRHSSAPSNDSVQKK